ncbi:MAG TPA: hypothetical protein VJM33_00875 [Microthrixaceae bacterium]|nr:hypothetical protein [Microthrixaceae bacterium]
MFRFGRIVVAVVLASVIAGCGRAEPEESMSPEDASVVAALGQAREMTGTFELDVSNDGAGSTFEVTVADGNYHIKPVALAEGATPGPGELLFLADGRTLSRTGDSAWTVQPSVQAASMGNPGAILDSFAGMRGYSPGSTEDLAGRETTRFVAEASEAEQVMKVMGLDQLEAVGGSELTELLGQFLAETSRIEETVWVDDEGQLAQATLELSNSAGERPECEFLPGEITFTVTDVRVDESAVVAVPADAEVTEAPPTSAPAVPGAGQIGTMAAALQSCFK